MPSKLRQNEKFPFISSQNSSTETRKTGKHPLDVLKKISQANTDGSMDAVSNVLFLQFLYLILS